MLSSTMLLDAQSRARREVAEADADARRLRASTPDTGARERARHRGSGARRVSAPRRMIGALRHV